MSITGPFASYMEIDWSNSVDTSGSSYRILHRLDGSDNVLAESSAETRAVTQDLTPATEYVIVLQRQEVDSSWSEQNEVIANTLSASMTLSSLASKTIELSWNSLYAGALFEVFSTASGGTPVGSGTTTDLTTVLRDLLPGTDYTLRLVVYELGQPVGLSKLGLTTNQGSTPGIKMGLIALAVITLILLIIKFK